MNLFDKNLKRNALIKIGQELDFSLCRNIKVNVHRNHSFEPIQSIIDPFLHFSNLKANFKLGSYDDSLNLEEISQADLEIVWLDLSRYNQEWEEHIYQQLDYLRSISKAPILVFLMDLQSPLNSISYTNHQTEIYLLSQILKDEENLLDLAKFSITATKLSNHACIILAQILGLKLIPSILLPSLKAIILDLDNTLYDGVLGEDGINGISISKEHQLLQAQIKNYKEQGFLLALASKNEEEDAKKLFQKRSDFILSWDDFDRIEVNWNNKSDNIQQIAKFFNIGLDSLLFIDDNIAEIENTKQLGIKTILATSPQHTLEVLKLFPQLHKVSTTKEDLIRSKDIQANQLRKKLEALSPEEYFKSLQISLQFFVNDKQIIQRMTELLNKTNQFISNYTRPTEQEILHDIKDPNRAIVAVSMSDKLSDSGIIAIIRGEKINEELHINDICISCRALGRKLEEIILFKSCEILKEKLQIMKEEFVLHYQQGERNKPFLDFIFLTTPSKTPSPLCIPVKNLEIKGLIIKES